MPRFTFECSECQLVFEKTLKQGMHESFPCDNCFAESPRVFEGFGFGFSEGVVPGNSGVTKHDYPTADFAVGSDADKRWGELHARAEVKEKVREVGGHRALIRRQGVEDGKPFVEYEAGSKALLDARKAATSQVRERLKDPTQ